jgi:hypothetical protein
MTRGKRERREEGEGLIDGWKPSTSPVEASPLQTLVMSNSSNDTN